MNIKSGVDPWLLTRIKLKTFCIFLLFLAIFILPSDFLFMFILLAEKTGSSNLATQIHCDWSYLDNNSSNPTTSTQMSVHKSVAAPP